MDDKDVENWKKRLNRKKPFHIYRTEPFDESYVRKDGVHFDRRGTRYYVIWNDGHKTKFGALSDHMTCRYGIETICVLNGDTKFDLWNGHNIDDSIFDEMIKVRNEESELLEFNLDTLIGLTH
jgi:hypothetical protein